MPELNYWQQQYVNKYGQPVDAQNNIVNTGGFNAGLTNQQIQDRSINQGGSGSSSVYDSKTGQTLVTTTPNLLGQEADIAANQARLNSDLTMKQAAQKAQLAQDAYNQRLNSLRMFSSSGGSAPQVQHPGSGSEGMANALAFGQAKDTAGQLALGALKSMQGMMAERGLTGSTDEANAASNILQGGAAQIAGMNKDQLLAQIARQNAVNDMVYQGNITQRAQDLSAQQALYGLITSGLGVY